MGGLSGALRGEARATCAAMGRLQVVRVRAATRDEEVHAGGRGVEGGAACGFAELRVGRVLCADERNAVGSWEPMASGRRQNSRRPLVTLHLFLFSTSPPVL